MHRTEEQQCAGARGQVDIGKRKPGSVGKKRQRREPVSAPNAGPGVTVASSGLTGYAWAENLGWINLSPVGGGGVSNNGNGTLSGYAWGENAGWINFSPPGAGVLVDGSTGQFSGYAWGENVGWINFGIANAVVTSWRASSGIFEDGFE